MTADSETFAGVDYSSPTTFSNTMTSGYSPILTPVIDGSDMSIIGGNGADLNTSTMNISDVFQSGGGGRRRKKSRRLKRSNKTRLNSRSKKSKSRSKVNKVRRSLSKRNRKIKRKSKRSKRSKRSLR